MSKTCERPFFLLLLLFLFAVEEEMEIRKRTRSSHLLGDTLSNTNYVESVVFVKLGKNQKERWFSYYYFSLFFFSSLRCTTMRSSHPSGLDEIGDFIASRTLLLLRISFLNIFSRSTESGTRTVMEKQNDRMAQGWCGIAIPTSRK